MCVQDSDRPADQDLLKSSNLYHNQPPINDNSDNSNHNNGISNEGRPDLQSQIDSLNTQMQNTSSPNSNSLPVRIPFIFFIVLSCVSLSCGFLVSL